MTRTYTNKDGQDHRYVVFVPRSVSGRKHPVVLFLNGVGENGNDGLRQISNNFGRDLWRMRETFPFLAVCPQCSPSGSWSADSPDSRRALAILDEAVAEFNGDPDRICLTGVSAGGSGVWEIASAHPDRFAAQLVVASGGGGDPARLADARLPTWALYNVTDRRELVDSARANRQALLEAGASPITSELSGHGHNAWDEAYGSAIVWTWLLEQSRSKNTRRGRFVLLNPREILATWERQGTAEWMVDGEQTISASMNETGDESLLIRPPLEGDYEFHLDAHLEDGGVIRISMLTADRSRRRNDLVLPLPATGLGEVWRADGSAVPVDPIGQRALRPGWNDVRLTRVDDRFQASLGGVRLLETADPADRGPVRVALAARSGEPPLRWRNLRFRTASPESPPEDAP